MADSAEKDSSRLTADPARAVSLALATGIPIATCVAVPAVNDDTTGGEVAFVLGVAWLPAIASVLRAPSKVLVASWALTIPTLVWGAVVWVLATPCALSGRMILTPTPQCSVQATHVVNAVVGGASFLALVGGLVSGIRFGVRSADGAYRIYRVALLLAAVLILVALVSNAVLPRMHPSD